MINLKISGMSCGHCSSAVKKALEGVAGVTTVEVDLAGGSAAVEGRASVEALVAAVQDAGYEASAAA